VAAVLASSWAPPAVPLLGVRVQSDGDNVLSDDLVVAALASLWAPPTPESCSGNGTVSFARGLCYSMAARS
jgi:hypothetical protein